VGKARSVSWRTWLEDLPVEITRSGWGVLRFGEYERESRTRCWAHLLSQVRILGLGGAFRPGRPVRASVQAEPRPQYMDTGNIVAAS
jgi:hypothetical protein